jgi:5-methyltetrahydrofolate--homocysteine methyltransferase
MEAEKSQAGAATRGKVLLATVKGDVHDIGKNIVGVVLACNNYEVLDLGVMVPCDRILREAREKNVDMVGLSGLITPSLDEMVHVAREMEREGFTVPLLIGGATTSRAHTAVKIAPAYSSPVVHVLDASRAVGTVGRLKSPDGREALAGENRRAQEKLRDEHRRKAESRPLLDLEEARRRRPALDWSAYSPPRPSFLGARAEGPVPLAELVPFIDWSPFFATWEMPGTYPRIFDTPGKGAEARRLFDDAQELLRRIVAEGRLEARVAVGFWPANSVGDDIEVYADEERRRPLSVLHTLRQQTDFPGGLPNRALADLVAPRETGLADYVGAFAVTAGHGLDELVRELEGGHDDYAAIMAKALADRLVEALAERTHKRAREAWGYGRGEDLSPEDLIHERYRGIRPAPGYPACPDHSEKRTLFALLEAEKGAGIRLSETFAMIPGSSVSALLVAHPEARYFTVGPIGADQVLDYQRRKGISLGEAERWLSPNLAYERQESTPAPASA